MKRFVIDTNVVVSALLKSDSKPSRVLHLMYDKTMDLYYSDLITKEYVKVLYRKHLKLDVGVVNATLEDIKRHGTNLVITPSTIPLPDEDDRVFYDTAVSAGAYLITGNIKHFPQEPFILTPADFLALPETQAS